MWFTYVGIKSYPGAVLSVNIKNDVALYVFKIPMQTWLSHLEGS